MKSGIKIAARLLLVSAAAKDLAEENLEIALGNKPLPPTSQMNEIILRELRNVLKEYGVRVTKSPNYGPVPVNRYRKTLYGTGR